MAGTATGQTFATLQQYVLDTAENNDTVFAENIPNFVRAAELRIFRDCDLRVFRVNAQATMVAGDPFLDLPVPAIGNAPTSTEFQNVIIRDFHIIDSSGRRVFLLYKNYDFIRDFWPNDTLVGKPRYYANWLWNVVIVAPTPDRAYVAEMQFSALPTSIVDANVSWLGDNAWDALFAATMIEAFAFMRGEDKAIEPSPQGPPPGLWWQQYDNAKQRLITQEGRQRVDDYRAQTPR